ncbi:MAG: hypothetical protein CMC11_00980 [Flavobacteriaceae bacterium]|nr:hypothetical protein [Flavobacteriaceae bacterium]
MYNILKTVHSYWAFFVLTILFIAILNSLIRIISKKSFNSTDLRISLFGLIFSHIQLLIGLILYFISPWFDQWSSLGMGIMKNNESRLYLVEHPITNILAIFFITIGWSLHKKQSESSKKFLRISLFYGFGYILLLSRIPWSKWL